MTETYDLAVVGVGVLGLAHAPLAVRAGRRVVVAGKDAKAGARASRNIWSEIVSEVGIPFCIAISSWPPAGKKPRR